MRTLTGWPVKALTGCVAVLLAAGAWSATTIEPSRPTTIVSGGRAGATGVGGAELLDEATPAPAPATTVAPVPSSTTVAPTTSTTRRPAPTTTKVPTTRPLRPATTTTTADLPAFMKAIPNPPGYLAAASSWEAKGDGVSLRLRVEPASPVAGEPMNFVLDYTGGDACCVVELHFGDGSPHFLANHAPPCVAGGTLSPGPHRTVVSHTYDLRAPYRVLAKILDGDLCGPTPVLHHLEMFACIAVGPGVLLTPGCDPLPPYGAYEPQ